VVYVAVLPWVVLTVSFDPCRLVTVPSTGATNRLFAGLKFPRFGVPAGRGAVPAGAFWNACTKPYRFPEGAIVITRLAVGPPIERTVTFTPA
jgi:hypothetical protein